MTHHFQSDTKGFERPRVAPSLGWLERPPRSLLPSLPSSSSPFGPGGKAPGGWQWQRAISHLDLLPLPKADPFPFLLPLESSMMESRLHCRSMLPWGITTSYRPPPPGLAMVAPEPPGLGSASSGEVTVYGGVLQRRWWPVWWTLWLAAMPSPRICGGHQKVLRFLSLDPVAADGGSY